MVMRRQWAPSPHQPHHVQSQKAVTEISHLRTGQWSTASPGQLRSVELFLHCCHWLRM